MQDGRCEPGEWSIKQYVRHNRFLLPLLQSFFDDGSVLDKTNDNFAIIKVAVLHLDGSDACLSDINGRSIMSNSYSHHLYALYAVTTIKILFRPVAKVFEGKRPQTSSSSPSLLVYIHIQIFSRVGGSNIITKKIL